ncbi:MULTISPECIES: hypothetical protein [Pseudomonas]|jgi:hypothetical protein|uniref:hypothetical protein n=1 Tax=Pseudomonas TaxID=286 RepID=UPI0021F83FB9|nr:hypothetical protein [Pseudomonas putida]
MAIHAFLLTYSVSPAIEQDREHQNQAARLRQKLNRVELEDWTKLQSVETAFSGIMHLSQSILSKKRQEAQDIAWNQFKDVMDSLGAYRDTNIHVALMVQGLGELIELSI